MYMIGKMNWDTLNMFTDLQIAISLCHMQFFFQIPFPKFYHLHTWTVHNGNHYISFAHLSLLLVIFWQIFSWKMNISSSGWIQKRSVYLRKSVPASSASNEMTIIPAGVGYDLTSPSKQSFSTNLAMKKAHVKSQNVITYWPPRSHKPKGSG